MNRKSLVIGIGKKKVVKKWKLPGASTSSSSSSSISVSVK